MPNRRQGFANNFERILSALKMRVLVWDIKDTFGEGVFRNYARSKSEELEHNTLSSLEMGTLDFEHTFLSLDDVLIAVSVVLMGAVGRNTLL